MNSNPFGLPADVATVVLPLAAEVIEHADIAAAGKWGLTDYDPNVRINVGFTEVLTTGETQLTLIVDRHEADLSKLPTAVAVSGGPKSGPFYPSIPNSVCIEIPYRPIKQLVKTIDQVRPGFYAAVESAGRKAVGQGVKRGHAPDLVREIGRFLRRRLPQPVYLQAGGPSRGKRTLDESQQLIEGALQRVVTNRFERNPKARRACISHYGDSCNVCGFSFGIAFGLRGKGFIHVHHISPISKQKGTYAIDPVRDMRPVCPNCHAMLHTEDPPIKVDTLRSEIRRRK